MKRLVKVLAVVLVLGLLTTAVVSAEQAEGTGTIKAIGAGVARVEGDGRVEIRGLGIGTVWVRGAEDLRAAGRGIRWDLPGGVVYFVGWSGHIEARGENMVVNMAGSLIEFKATGTGTVYLKGRGHYWINGEEGLWSTDGAAVQLQLSP
jgi:hypothetical protein